MIQSLETKSDHIPARKVIAPRNILIMLVISIATILVSTLSGSALATSGMEQTRGVGYAHLLLFDTSSLNKPLR